MPGKNVYEVQLKDGRKKEVETPLHHDNHDAATWLRHIVDLLRDLSIHVAAHEISRIIHKGRR